VECIAGTVFFVRGLMGGQIGLIKKMLDESCDRRKRGTSFFLSSRDRD
jgi:hypothetical protein